MKKIWVQYLLCAPTAPSTWPMKAYESTSVTFLPLQYLTVCAPARALGPRCRALSTLYPRGQYSIRGTVGTRHHQALGWPSKDGPIPVLVLGNPRRGFCPLGPESRACALPGSPAECPLPLQTQRGEAIPFCGVSHAQESCRSRQTTEPFIYYSFISL